MARLPLLLLTLAACEGDKEAPVDSEPDAVCSGVPAAADVVHVLSACDGDLVREIDAPWTATEQWRWEGINGLVWQVTGTVAAGILRDDDGDGVVGRGDTPSVAVVVGEGAEAQLALLDGFDGELVWAAEGFYGESHVGLADLDGDGVSEILAFSDTRQLRALRADGTPMWTAADAESLCFSFTVADLDGDGAPEIVTASAVLNGLNGQRLRSLDTFGADNRQVPLVADLDLDGVPEIILRNVVQDVYGNELWAASMSHQLMPAVVQADDDPEAEVLMIGDGSFRVFDHDGEALVSLPPLRGQQEPAGICAGDLDGDGAMEVAWSDLSDREFTVAELDGEVLWTRGIDLSNGGGACSVFDFNGDGALEVLLSDRNATLVLDGAAGTERLRLTNQLSTTHYNLPVIVDVDDDGAAELLLSSASSDHPGVIAVRHSGEGWPPVGRGWSAQAFNAASPDALGALPESWTPSWQTAGPLRGRLIEPQSGAPDLTGAIHEVCPASCEGGVARISVQVENQGGDVLPSGTPWVMTRGDDGALITTGFLDELAPGERAQGFILQVDAAAIGDAGFTLTLDLDAQGRSAVTECDEDNNTLRWEGSVCE